MMYFVADRTYLTHFVETRSGNSSNLKIREQLAVKHNTKICGPGIKLVRLELSDNEVGKLLRSPKPDQLSLLLIQLHCPYSHSPVKVFDIFDETE